MKRFEVVLRDGIVSVEIGDDGHAVLRVGMLNDAGPLAEAIRRASEEGARSGTLFTGDVVNDDIAERNLAHARLGTTWLGGTVTRLEDVEGCPCFRIDWSEFPRIAD